MAVAFRSLVSVAGDPAARTVSKPSGVTSGDCLVLILSYGQEDNTTTPALPTVTPPSGFTLAKRQTYPFDNTGSLPKARQTVEVYVKIAGGSEPSSYTVSFDIAAWCQLVMMAYTGTDQTTPVDVTSSATYGPSTTSGTETAPGVTVSRASSVLLWIHGNYFLPGTNPTGFTTRVVDLDDALDVSEKAVNAGATGNVDSTVAGDSFSLNGGAVVLVALQPPGAGPTDYPFNLSESAISVSDSMTGTFGAQAGLTETSLAVSDALSGLAAYQAGLSESSLAVNDALAGVAGYLGSLSETSLSASDSMAGTFGALGSLAESSLAASDSMAGLWATTFNLVETFTFRDDFNTLNENVWMRPRRQGDPANGELHCFQPEQVSVSGGRLVITSEAFSQSCGDAHNAPSSHDYRSGELIWRGSSFAPSASVPVIFKFRVRIPAGVGCWPAIWTLGTPWQEEAIEVPGSANPDGATWDTPPYNEVDMLEVFSPTNSGTVKQIIHNNGQSGGDVALGFDPTAAEHDYEWIWAQGSATWKVDGSVTKTITGAAVPSNPMFPLITVAVGGNGGGTPDAGTFPAQMLVDYFEITSPVIPVSDAMTAVRGCVADLAESALSASDAAAYQLGAVANDAEGSLSVTDDLLYQSSTSNNFTFNLSEGALSVSDSMAGTAAYQAQLAETALSAADSMAGLFGAAAGLVETALSVVDQLAGQFGAQAALSESSLSAADSLSGIFAPSFGLAEGALSVSDQLAWQFAAQAALAETVLLSERLLYHASNDPVGTGSSRMFFG